MKKMLFLMLMFSIVLLAAQSQGIPATPKTPDEKALSMVLSMYAENVNSGDGEAWISLWDADGIQLAPGEPMHIGRPEVWKLNKDGFGASDIQFNVVQNEILVFGGYGYVRGTYSYTVKPKTGGDTIFFAGKYLTFCRKQPDGTWRIYRDTFSSDAP